LKKEHAMPDIKKPSSLSLAVSRISRRIPARPDAQEALETQWPLLESRSSRFFDTEIPALKPSERDTRRTMGVRKAAEPLSKGGMSGVGEQLSRVLSDFFGRARDENASARSDKPPSVTKKPARSGDFAFVAPSLTRSKDERGPEPESIKHIFSKLVCGKEASKPEPVKTPPYPFRRK
jgi:hypothetical protein